MPKPIPLPTFEELNSSFYEEPSGVLSWKTDRKNYTGRFVAEAGNEAT
jgi:hypothetical protein